MKLSLIAALLIGAAGLLIGCSTSVQNNESEENIIGYKQISQEEAKEMMSEDDGHIVVDVRRQDEYDSGHIPGAICIPNETIGQMKPAELPDLDQVILVYCRSGNRSKQASQKLSDIGYINVYEFGGILEWTGETVTGGTVSSTLPDPSLIENEDSSGEGSEDITDGPYQVLTIDCADTSFVVQLEKNSSADGLAEKLSLGAIELEMSDYGGFEKVGELPWELPTNDTQITTVPGDVILYQGNKITVYYGENTWSFTKLGHIDATREELLSALGSGDVQVRLSLEYRE